MKICYTEMKNILQFTINVRKSHGQSQRTLQLVCENRMLFVRVDLHMSLCRQQNPKRERATRLVNPSLLCKLRSLSKATDKNLTVLVLEIQKALSP
jgi:hypothetical protein